MQLKTLDEYAKHCAIIIAVIQMKISVKILKGKLQFQKQQFDRSKDN